MSQVLIASYSVEIRPATTWQTLPTSAVLEVSGLAETNGNTDAALAPGDSSTLSIDARIAYSAISEVVIDDLPIRVTYQISSSAGTFSARSFVGHVVKAETSYRGSSWSLRAEGIAQHIAKTRAWSPVFERRPPATKTTAASIEDPANGNYRGGILNWLMWQAGGRPFEQQATYPNALFYYTFEQAQLAIDYAWLEGENGWDEALNIVRTVGGQLFQRQDGVVQYRQPLGFGATTGGHTFSDAGTRSASLTRYSDIQVARRTRKRMTRLICAYVERRRMALQQVIDDTTATPIQHGKDATITLTPDNPLASLQLDQYGKLPVGALTIVDGLNRPVQAEIGYYHSVVWSARKIELTITNVSGGPITVHRVQLSGEPVAKAAAGVVTIGAGDATGTLTLPDSVYIQRASHAEWLCQVTLALQGGVRPVYTLRDCPYDPRRTTGEVVLLEVQKWAIASSPWLIIGIRHERTGTRSHYDLIPVGDLPRADQFYLVGPTNYAGSPRLLAW